jgi:REP element-mobilizing transposase RayT
MPRYARLRAPGALVHVISRVVNREFRIVGETERDQYIQRLRKSLQRTDWNLVGFALMSNHVHLALRAGYATSARLIQSVHGGYAAWLNKHQARLGPVFAERHATVISDETKAARLIAYLHNNPVRAGVVPEAAESAWTSQRAYLEGDGEGWLDVELGMSLAGFESSAAGRANFYDFVRAASTVTRDDIIEEGLMASRRAVRHAVGPTVEISSREVGANGGGVQIIASPFASIRPRWPGDVETALMAVEVHTGVPIERMRTRERQRRIVGARRLALHLWTMHLGRPQATMAAALGISRQAASKLLMELDPATSHGAQLIAKSLWDLFSPTYANES